VQDGHGGITSEGIKSAEDLLRANLKGVAADQDVVTQLEVLKQTFELFDRDGDGIIDNDEFHKITSVMGLDMSKQQAEALVTEVDADGTGGMGFDEFIVMMGRRQDQVAQDLEGAWKLLDPDGVGFFEADKLKDLVLKSGILLTCWELKEMVEAADLNHDGKIDHAEFMQASQALPWQRCKRLGVVQEDILETWKMIAGGTEEADKSAIKACFQKLGCLLSDTELNEMLAVADDNGDGKMSYQEFAVAYHSKTWRRARLLGPMQKQLRQLQTAQERNYAAWHNREIEEARECGLSTSGHIQEASRVSGLLERRKLRRNRTVRAAVVQVWQALAGARRPVESGEPHVVDWVERDLYVTTLLHIAKSISDDDDFFVPAVKALIEEEWIDLVRAPVDIKTMTLHQRSRANRGDLRWMDRPEGWKCIGYGKFYDTLFEVVDSEVGFGENTICKDRYAQYMRDLLQQMVVDKPDGCYHW